MSNKIIFLDRDGTVIDEPEDKQIDSFIKLNLKPNVIPALIVLIKAGFKLVMVTNQDGLGTHAFPKEDFTGPHDLLINILHSQGIQFEQILICPHFANESCQCRKPNLGLVMDYLRNGKMNFKQSYVIGDRQTDMEFAKNIGIQGILYDDDKNWLAIANELSNLPRRAEVKRETTETSIQVSVDFNQADCLQISTGLGFFDHMLEQLAKHAGFGLKVKVSGDLYVDEHHTVEDTALSLGQALREALGDKLGIARFGFVLPMDEALATVAIDLSGRSYLVFTGKFVREKVGELPTELVSHFFRSLAESMGAAIHIKVEGENEHHMIESIFKGVGRSLRQAITKNGNELPSTKGVL